MAADPLETALARQVLTQLRSGKFDDDSATLASIYRRYDGTVHGGVFRNNLASRKNLPEDILVTLTRDPAADVRLAAICNPATPADAAYDAARYETSKGVVSAIAAAGGNEYALRAIAERVTLQPTRSISPTKWLPLAGALLAHDNLGDKHAVAVVTAVLRLAPHIKGSGCRSALYKAQDSVREWLGRNTRAARELARSTKDGWLCQEIAKLPGATVDDALFAVVTCLIPLVAKHDSGGSVPSDVEFCARALVRAADGREHVLNAIRDALAPGGWRDFRPDLRTALFAASDAEIDEIMARGDLADALRLFDSAQVERPRERLAVFCARRDVPTLDAVTLLSSVSAQLFVADLEAWRPWDEKFPVAYLAQNPLLWSTEPRTDVTVKAIAYKLPGWADFELGTYAAYLNTALAERLGERVLDLPWQLTTKMASPHIAAALAPILADPQAEIMFLHLAGDKTRTLREIADLATAVAAPVTATTARV